MLENFISTFLGFSYVHTFQHKTKEANTVFSYYKYRNDNNNLNNYHVDAVQGNKTFRPQDVSPLVVSP